MKEVPLSLTLTLHLWGDFYWLLFLQMSILTTRLWTGRNLSVHWITTEIICMTKVHVIGRISKQEEIESLFLKKKEQIYPLKIIF